jgi:hypothetical protein
MMARGRKRSPKAREKSPRRKPWVIGKTKASPEEAEESASFALSGLHRFPILTPGLRPGLYSSAATRLEPIHSGENHVKRLECLSPQPHARS